jgi:hypothetical protein
VVLAAVFLTNVQQQRPARRRAGEHWHAAPGVIAHATGTVDDEGMAAESHSSGGNPNEVSTNANTNPHVPIRDRDGRRFGIRHTTDIR